MSESPVVLITGAARRIGASIARTLHARGARVVLHYHRSAGEAAMLADELNGQRAGTVACHGADLAEAGALGPLVDAALLHFGRLDALVNNASSFFSTPVGSIDVAAWDDLMASNLKAPLFLAQAAAPHLLASGGCIVNITDVHAERPLPGHAVYCAAKAGLLGLTRALALDLAPRVRVNAVAPGAIQWPEQDMAFPPGERAAIVASTPLRRTGAMEDIARTVAFLVFDAPFITGQVINVDGGRTARL